MQITHITTYVVPARNDDDPQQIFKPAVFIRLETGSGITGWGEACSLTHRTQLVVSFIHALAEGLIGANIHDPQKMLELAKNNDVRQSERADLYSAISGIEIAMWDALGKHHRTPVYKLMGDTRAADICLYVNMFSRKPRSDVELVCEILEQKELGFTAAKVYPFMGDAKLDDAVTMIGKIRDAAGPEFGIAVDLWRSFDPPKAMEICRTLSQFNLLWIEDPFETSLVDELAQLRQSIEQPLMAGEILSGKEAFQELLSKSALDQINPDVCLCGGISEFREIATLAAKNNVGVSPHYFGSMTVGLAATAHAALGVSNLALAEYYPAIRGRFKEFCTSVFEPVNGRLRVRDQPGLGIELNSKALAKFEAKP